jgi:tetratricopeptide (TPR) repeat protein
VTFSAFRIPIVLCLPWLAAGCSRAVELDVSHTFQQAQATFDKATTPDDFLAAASLYQQILDRGVVSGAVLYNQGNAYMRAGHRGRAIAAYRQAQRYRPRDPYLEANLRNALGSDPSPGRRKPLVEYLLFWQDWLSYPEKFTLLGAAAVLSFASATAGLILRRRLWSRVAIAGLVATLVLAISAGYDWHRFDHTVHGVIVAKKAVARKGNATSYEPAFTESLVEGTEFTLCDQRGAWLLIRLRAGQEGWVKAGEAVVY